MATTHRDQSTESLVHQFVEGVWNGDDPTVLETLTTPGFVLHQLVAGERHDREAFASFQAEMRSAIPDLTVAVEDLVVEEGDAVAFVRMSGTPERPMQAVRPTGESFDVHAFQKYRVEDGRIAEVWVMVDAIGTMQQLGLFPPSPGTMLRIAAGKAKTRLVGG